MKTKLTTTLLIAVAGVFAFRAQSNEPVEGPSNTSVQTSQMGQELLDTLTQAWDGRLAQYRGGRAESVHVIRVNEDLYHTHLRSVAAGDRAAVVKDYLARARKIEAIAARNLTDGTGTKMELLEAKASRLKAQMEIAKFQH